MQMSPEELRLIIQADLDQRLPSPFEHRVEVVEPGGTMKLFTKIDFKGQVLQVSFEEEYRLYANPIVLADIITNYVSKVRYEADKALEAKQ